MGALTITTTRRRRFAIHVAGGLPTSRVCVIVRRAAADVTKWRDLRCADEMVFDCANKLTDGGCCERVNFSCGCWNTMIAKKQASAAFETQILASKQRLGKLYII